MQPLCHKAHTGERGSRCWVPFRLQKMVGIRQNQRRAVGVAGSPEHPPDKPGAPARRHPIIPSTPQRQNRLSNTRPVCERIIRTHASEVAPQARFGSPAIRHQPSDGTAK